jgi:hypothetical protein
LSVARPHLGWKLAVVAALALILRTSGHQINHVVRSSGTFHPQLCFAQKKQ